MFEKGLISNRYIFIIWMVLNLFYIASVVILNNAFEFRPISFEEEGSIIFDAKDNSCGKNSQTDSRARKNNINFFQCSL